MAFQVKQGNWGLYGHQVSEFGYTISHDTDMGSVHYHVDTIEEVEKAREEFINDTPAREARAQAISDYLTSDEGKWGRQDSFDNSGL